MLDITPICQRFGKKAGHFKDNYENKQLFGIESAGRAKHTTISDDLIPDFLLWLSRGHKEVKDGVETSREVPELRTILARQSVEAALTFAKGFKR